MDITTLDEEMLHRIVASVDQESYFFYTSIRENMQLANVRVSDDAIWQALEMVELDEIVRALPQGLDTILSENARAFSRRPAAAAGDCAHDSCQEPQIAILDEALQKLDKRLAERIFAAASGLGRRADCDHYQPQPDAIGKA